MRSDLRRGGRARIDPGVFRGVGPLDGWNDSCFTEKLGQSLPAPEDSPAMNASRLPLALLTSALLVVGCSKAEPPTAAPSRSRSREVAPAEPRSSQEGSPGLSTNGETGSGSKSLVPPQTATTGVAGARPPAASLDAPIKAIAKNIAIVQAGEVPGEADDPEHAGENAHAWHPSLDGTPGDGLPRWPCRDERAFRASSPLVFEGPTDPDLIAPLTEATRGSSKSNPSISLVFHRTPGNQELLASLAPTRTSAEGRPAFVANLTASQAPAAAPLILAFGDQPAVTTEHALPTGSLRLAIRTGDRAAPVFLALRRLLWRANAVGDPTQPHGCDELAVDVHALLPLSELSVALPVAGGTKTIGEILAIPTPPGGFDEEGLRDDIRVRGHLPPPPAIHFHFRAQAAAGTFDGASGVSR
jgi:hypothetical protein